MTAHRQRGRHIAGDLDCAEETREAQGAEADVGVSQEARQAEASDGAGGSGCGATGAVDYERTIGERDARIAELEAQVAEAAKSAETADELQQQIAELKAQGESDRIDFQLRLAGVRSPQREGRPCRPRQLRGRRGGPEGGRAVAVLAGGGHFSTDFSGIRHDGHGARGRCRRLGRAHGPALGAHSRPDGRGGIRLPTGRITPTSLTGCTSGPRARRCSTRRGAWRGPGATSRRS